MRQTLMTTQDIKCFDLYLKSQTPHQCANLLSPSSDIQCIYVFHRALGVKQNLTRLIDLSFD